VIDEHVGFIDEAAGGVVVATEGAEAGVVLEDGECSGVSEEFAEEAQFSDGGVGDAGVETLFLDGFLLPAASVFADRDAKYTEGHEGHHTRPQVRHP